MEFHKFYATIAKNNLELVYNSKLPVGVFCFAVIVIIKFRWYRKS